MLQELPLASIRSGQDVANDRTIFSAEGLLALADNIAKVGLIQPITVRPSQSFENAYEIVAGERRYRAVQLLGWQTVPAMVTDLPNEAASAVMLTENMARVDLDPIDEAGAYRQRMDCYGWTAKRCAEAAGVTTVRVQARLSLLTLRADVQMMVRQGHLPIGYAYSLSCCALDADRQMLAISRLRDNPTPTPSWFRRECAELLEQQSQTALFEWPSEEQQTTKKEVVLPAHPSTTEPPRDGATLEDVLHNQVSFWLAAAEDWDRMGKPFKRQECQAAAQALGHLLQGERS